MMFVAGSSSRSTSAREDLGGHGATNALVDGLGLRIAASKIGRKVLSFLGNLSFR